jgi:uncharacterized damage-inducible protein DinB
VDAQVERLLGVLDRAYDRKSWHGTNLRGSVRGMGVEEAAWRPGEGRHNAWEVAVHAAYWKYAVWRRLTGAPRGSFPLAGSDWFARPEPGAGTEAAWKADLELLAEMHRRLREAVAALDPAALDRPAGGGHTTAFDLVAGAAAHDLYHAGQIQLLKRLRGA